MNDSPTPRTDAEAIGSCGIHSPEMVRSVFARQLERDLSTAKAALKMLHDDTSDYIRTNNLGKIHHNAAMRQAALVLGIPFEL